MFYIWHTLLIAGFIGLAYYLGFKYGEKAKATKKSKAKLWKALKQPTIAHGGSVGPIINYPNKDTSHSEWLKGYWQWRKTNQKQNDRTSK